MGLAKRVLLRLLKRTMRASDADIASPLFQERIARFVASGRAGRRLALRIAQHMHRMPKKSRRNGLFQALLRIPVERVIKQARQAAHPFDESNGAGTWLPLEVIETGTRGQACLLGRTGLSVISDIDDTLKHSHVACKRTLLTNTFLRPFETIPGMAPLFREWSAAGAAFHYVSSSPWQLYEHLAAHLDEEGFPLGSFHLRPFRLRDHLLRRMLMMRRAGKLGVIRSIMKTFPQRRFLLVGDSGERDPEIYGALARRYARQVAGIFIRDLGADRDVRRRYERAFRGVDSSLVRMFTAPEELADVPVQ
jgi:hypothetical protein